MLSELPVRNAGRFQGPLQIENVLLVSIFVFDPSSGLPGHKMGLGFAALFRVGEADPLLKERGCRHLEGSAEIRITSFYYEHLLVFWESAGYDLDSEKRGSKICFIFYPFFLRHSISCASPLPAGFVFAFVVTHRIFSFTEDLPPETMSHIYQYHL